MELRQLRAFVTVATVGHFGQAAAQLNLTQPSLTQRIQALERELGVRLLDRNAREVRLTEAGTLLLPRAQKLIQLEDEAMGELKEFRSGVTGQLHIAYHAAGDSALAGAIVAEFHHRYPDVHVETSAGSSGANMQRLRDGSADAAFALLPEVRPRGMAALRIRPEEIILVLRSDHRLAQFEKVPVTALRGEGVGLPPAPVNPDLFPALTRWLEVRTGAPLNVVSEEPSDLAIETLARSGRAAVVAVRRYAVLNRSEGLSFKSMSPAPYVDLAIAYREDDPSPTLGNLLKVVEDLIPPEHGGLPEDAEMV